MSRRRLPKPSRTSRPASGNRRKRKTKSTDLVAVVRKTNGKLEFELVPIKAIRINPYAARTHTKDQIERLVRLYMEFGFVVPIVIDENNVILAGHLRFAAVLARGDQFIPAVRVSELSERQKRAFMLADNKLAELSGWDQRKVYQELCFLSGADLSITIEDIGFDIAEIDLTFQNHGDHNLARAEVMPNEADLPKVTRKGDIWIIGRHVLICGDALDPYTLRALLMSETARIVVTDPPYNVKVDGHVSGKGAKRHREFAMASGEMSEAEFRQFLCETLQNLIAYSDNGALLYIFMDWRHIRILLDAARELGLTLHNICVWSKTNAGMGSMYRSQHELVAVFKHGNSPHINNIKLGKYGRNRSNVWTCAGANSFGGDRSEMLDMHPTVKPVELIKDIILDCTKRDDIVVDCFAGSGSTILAAEITGRRAYAAEIDELYVDTAVRRWEAYTGAQAVHADTGMTFAEMTDVRNPPASD